MRRSTLFVTLGLAMLATASSLMQTPAPAPAANQTNLGSDANGNPLRRALKTGHISNYDENKVAPYTLPDPLVMVSGTRVTGATMWNRQRRPELLRLYAQHIYGRVPTNVPKIAWEVSETDAHARDGAALLKRVVGHVGSKPDGPQIRVSVYTPAQATKKVPIILLLNFGGGPARAGGPPAAAGRGNAATGEPPNAAEILARGWGYATVGYNDIQPDRADAWTEGVIGQALQPGQTKPAADEWGTISAWAWGASRIADYLQSDRNVDGSRIALYGFSRLGKTVLWAAAQDERFKAGVLRLRRRNGLGTSAPRLGRDGRRHGAELSVAVQRELSAVARPLVGDAGRCPHADLAECAAAGVRDGRHWRSVVGSEG
jgi:hypothetical protein